MNRHLRTLLTGAAVVIPSAITLYVIYRIGLALDTLGRAAIAHKLVPPPGVAAVAVLVILLLGIYLIGLLAKLVVFRSLLSGWERLIGRVPVVKTLYESVRDLLQLFSGRSSGMGAVVEYRPPGMGLAMLGVLTNRSLSGTSAQSDPNLVSVYLPFTYMIGGVTVLADRRYLRELDMPAERALKLAATAHVEAPSAEPLKAAQVQAQALSEPTLAQQAEPTGTSRRDS